MIMALGAVVVQAQSTVTIYGILDAGYVGNNYKGISTSATTNQTTSSFGQSAQSPSRLGFKGSEDIGGGTSAFFTVETGLTPASSTASSWNNRQSFVGIKQNGIGEFAVGTQYTSVFNSLVLTDPGKLNDVVGSVLFPTPSQPYGNTGSMPYASASSSSGDTDAFTVRTTNTLTYKSENVNGFRVGAMYTLNNQNQTQTNSTTGGITNYNGYGLNASYEYQKLLITAAYQALKSYQSAATLTSPTPAIWSSSSGGTNTQDNQTYVAGTYDFGVVKAYVGWVNRKATDTLNTSYYASRSAQQIGVRGYWTPTIESWASIGSGKYTTYGVGQPTYQFVGYQVGTNYWLSKRTNLYAIFGSTQTSTIDVSANGYGVGLRHTF